jgi:glycosyltransferase involved in cell wall biosynthesis
MRLVLANPHTYAYGRTVASFLLGKKMLTKYDFFLQYYIKNKRKDVAFYIDGTRSSLSITSPFFTKGFAYTEYIFWMFLNGLNPFVRKVYFNIEELDPTRDILFTFSRSIIRAESEQKLRLDKFSGITLIHFTHYFQKIKKVAAYLQGIPHAVVVAENNLATNSFFRKHFPWIGKVYHLPFTYSDRFVWDKINFNERVNKCMALGTLCPVDDPDFFEFYGPGVTLQPMRNTLFENQAQFSGELDSYMKKFTKLTTLKQVGHHDSWFKKLLKKALPYVVLEKIFPVSQKAYFQFDIVRKYNEYRMFLCPEEIIGLPSVNVFEGMACRCAYIGIEDPMYTELGMLPGIHYIGYKENDVEDLISKIRYYQAHPDELERIAEAGYELVTRNFNKRNVSEVFWRDLERMSEQFVRSKIGSSICSFEKV